MFKWRKMEKAKETEETRPKEQKFAAAAAAAAVIEGMIDVVGISDMDGRIIQINTAVEDWGYKKEELIGKPVVEVLAKRSLPNLEEERKKTLETGVMRNLELIGLKKDGSEFPSLVNVSLMKDAEGKPTGRIFSLRDITELKKKTEELEKSAVYIDAMGDALMVLDARGKIIRINKAAEKLWGYTSEEFLKMTWDQILAKSVHEKTAAEMEAAVKTGSVRPFELIMLTKDGREIPAMISGTAMMDTAGKLAGFIGVFRDITELKKSQEELQKKVTDLEEFSKIAVERELDMKKLEEELEKLRGKK